MSSCNEYFDKRLFKHLCCVYFLFEIRAWIISLKRPLWSVPSQTCGLFCINRNNTLWLPLPHVNIVPCLPLFIKIQLSPRLPIRHTVMFFFSPKYPKYQCPGSIADYLKWNFWRCDLVIGTVFFKKAPHDSTFRANNSCVHVQ